MKTKSLIAGWRCCSSVGIAGVAPLCVDIEIGVAAAGTRRGSTGPAKATSMKGTTKPRWPTYVWSRAGLHRIEKERLALYRDGRSGERWHFRAGHWDD